MKIEHFTKTDLTNLSSCFLDPKGNFIFGSQSHEIGVHEEMAHEILEKVYGEDYELDNYDEIRACGMYTYQYLEEKLGYWRYSHWVGNYGVFNGHLNNISHAQKLAIRQYCRVNGATWKDVVWY